jgi:hypothetical protein
MHQIMEQTMHKNRIHELVSKLRVGEISLNSLIDQIENGAIQLYDELPHIREGSEPPTLTKAHTEEASAVLGVLYDDIVSLFDELVPGSAQERADFLAKDESRWETTLGERDDELARKASPELARRLDKFDDSFGDTENVIRYFLGYRDILRDEVNRRKQAKEKTGQEKPQLKSLATVDGFLRGPADPINQHMFGAFTPGAMKKHTNVKADVNNLEARGMTGIKDYTALYIVESNKDLYGVIGYKQDVGENLWELLQKHSALTLQAHIALFARAYAETDAAPGEFITLRILDFCDDLQFTRKKGYHDRETKQRVVNILECLTQAQMKIMYAPPQGKSYLLTGPIWQRGITQETASQPGGKLQWEPETFSYAPGQYFAFNEWRTYTRNVALIGEGLLKLNANNDKWAIHGGGYLALLSRMNGYRKQTLSVKTLLEKTGLFAAYAKFRKTSEMEQKLVRALETLEKVGVIENWNWSKDEYENTTLAGKLASETLLNRQIQIQYPVALRRNEKRIADGVAKHQKDN